MQSRIRYALVFFGALLVATAGFGQEIIRTGAEDTLSVRAHGSASAPADWVKVNVTVKSESASAETAMSMNLDNRERVRAALVEHGIDEDSVIFGTPQLSAGHVSMWGPEAEPEAKWQVRTTVTIQIRNIEERTIYERIARLVDVATQAGAAAPGAGEATMSSMFEGATRASFGVDDLEPLRAKAVKTALGKARGIAGIAAASAGRKLGRLTGLDVSEHLWASGQLGWMDVDVPMGEVESGMATLWVRVGADYELVEEGQ